MLLRLQCYDQVRRFRRQRLNHTIKGGDDVMKRAIERNALAGFLCNAA
jgi:hypothetical protein